MAFDLTVLAFDSIRALNAGTDHFIDNDDIPELTDEQLAEMKPLYNAEERAILQNNPTYAQRQACLRSAFLRLKQKGLKQES